MANKAYTEIKDSFARNCVVFIWEGLTDGDVGEPILLPGFADKTVQVKGNFGTGASVTIEGSNDVMGSPTYAALADAQGNVLSITIAKIEVILENPYLIRPNVSGGGGSVNLTVSICCKR
jgi:hypothetical protein